mmetsp:Transcript_125285/g.400472  ORF Transcript_125285/g.400472 Transcript_125285/m.400472 type:complete len:396 (-) Transcript_125285:85-1272(-)
MRGGQVGDLAVKIRRTSLTHQAGHLLQSGGSPILDDVERESDGRQRVEDHKLATRQADELRERSARNERTDEGQCVGQHIVLVVVRLSLQGSGGLPAALQNFLDSAAIPEQRTFDEHDQEDGQPHTDRQLDLLGRHQALGRLHQDLQGTTAHQRGEDDHTDRFHASLAYRKLVLFLLAHQRRHARQCRSRGEVQEGIESRREEHERPRLHCRERLDAEDHEIARHGQVDELNSCRTLLRSGGEVAGGLGKKIRLAKLLDVVHQVVVVALLGTVAPSKSVFALEVLLNLLAILFQGLPRRTPDRRRVRQWCPSILVAAEGLGLVGVAVRHCLKRQAEGTPLVGLRCHLCIHHLALTGADHVGLCARGWEYAGAFRVPVHWGQRAEIKAEAVQANHA